jgi:hypothetical protein
MLRSIGFKSGPTMFDLCCGDGYVSAPLARLVQGKVIALDTDGDIREQAKHEVAKAPAPGSALDLRRYRGDPCTEPVDFLLITNTLPGVPDQAPLAGAENTQDPDNPDNPGNPGARRCRQAAGSRSSPIRRTSWSSSSRSVISIRRSAFSTGRGLRAEAKLRRNLRTCASRLIGLAGLP